MDNGEETPEKSSANATHVLGATEDAKKKVGTKTDKEAVRIFFAAQRLAEKRPMRAKSRLSELVRSLEHEQPITEQCLASKTFKKFTPPLAVIASAAYNLLGELEMDASISATWQEAQRMLSMAIVYFKAALRLLCPNASAALSLALVHCTLGELDSALPLFTQVAAIPIPPKPRRKDQGWQEDWVYDGQRRSVPAAAYHRAHLLSRLGRHDEALPMLQRFGCRFRLAPCIWQSRGLDSSNASSWPRAPRLLRQAVPEQLMQGLRRGLSADASYWRENDYGSREYFSWYYNAKSDPTNLVEVLISKVLIPLTERNDFVAAEWWAHTRRPGSDLGHQLHFDMEEHTLEADGRILHPAVSCVVYLSGACGGTTVILDQTVDGGMADVGWLAPPCTGSVLLFPGDRLHGVLPCSPEKSGCEEPRLTLMVGLWDREDFAAGDRGTIGPQCQIPTDKLWPAALHTDGLDTCIAPEPTMVEETPVFVSPVWEAIPNDNSPAELQLPKDVDQRFFLVDSGNWRKRTLEDHGAEAKRRKCGDTEPSTAVEGSTHVELFTPVTKTVS